ncbi:Na-translocating system protein MpsC family protein (plasmid) [Ornithinibacillus sp. 16A2E]|uniref:Na-translocating system protein MpsC family protein n=1 Tax=Ornithinibacillus xuwenensis TaxID=3144668 RepID=A0ABU9XLB5_9BACI
MLNLDKQEAQKDLSSYIGRILRDNFGRGPESVFVSIKKPFISVYIRNFLSPMEKVLLTEHQETVVQTTRDILMATLIPEIKAYIRIVADMEIEQFYYDWGLHNHSGMFFAIASDKTDIDKLLHEDFFGKDALHKEIDHIGQQAEKTPEKVFSIKLNDRTYAVIRRGLFITIERELIRMGQQEVLKLAKRRIEKRLLHNNMRLESILDGKIDDSFVDWDFERDQSVILFSVNPNQPGGNELDK